MHLAVLMTNTDESAFAQRHPKDGEKFSSLIHSVRPDWTLACFSAKDGQFPKDISAFDGVMITGSPASVLEPEPWIAQLLDQIRIAHAAHVPLFGACFGHQAIALALGGRVERNPAGWGFGLIEMTVINRPAWFEGGDRLVQYGAHVDHVTALPTGATQVFATAHAQNAGFVIGDHVYTTQNHPEMTHEFITALIEEYATKMDADVVDAARKSLVRRADTLVFAHSIAAFFETTVRAASAH